MSAETRAGAPLGPGTVRLVIVLGLDRTRSGRCRSTCTCRRFPEITRSLDTSASPVQLTLTACVAGLALGQLVAGPLSDRFGRRRPADRGLVTYAVVSLLCALGAERRHADRLRFLQGLAGGAAGS